MKKFWLIGLGVGISVSLAISLAYADTGVFTWLKLKKTAVQSSSVLIEKGRPPSNYAAAKAVDHIKNTAWCEGKSGDGVGESLAIHFQPVQTYQVQTFPGIARTKSLYYANNRIKDYRLETTTTDGQKFVKEGRFPDHLCESWTNALDGKYTLAGYCKEILHESNASCVQRLQQDCVLDSYFGGGTLITIDKQFDVDRDIRPSPPCISSVKLTILSVYSGSKYRDTCVAEIGPAMSAFDPGNLIDPENPSKNCM